MENVTPAITTSVPAQPLDSEIAQEPAFERPPLPPVDEDYAFATISGLMASRRISPIDLPTWQMALIALAPQAMPAQELAEIVKGYGELASYRPPLLFTKEAITEALEKEKVWSYHLTEQWNNKFESFKVESEKIEEIIGNGFLGVVEYLKDDHALADRLRWNRTSEGLDVFASGKWLPDHRASGYDLLRRLLIPRLSFRLAELQELALNYVPKPSDDKRKKNPFEAKAEMVNSWISKMQSPSGMETLIKQISQTPGLVISEEDYDASPYTLNLLNGAYDLQANVFIPSNKLKPSERLCRNQVAVAYDPQAQAPEWAKFCAKVFTDSDAAKYVQTYVGIGLSGEMIERCLILYGAGANGKSTFLDVISRLTGGYSTSFNIHALMGDSRGVNPEYEIRKLKGVRLAFATESRKGSEFDESVLKKISSKDGVCCRYPYELPISFSPTHKVVLATNHKPKVKAEDKGTWRRLSMVRMDYDFDNDAEKKSDVEVAKIFQRELAGILNWLLEGWREYRAKGLTVPASIEQDTREYRCEEDKLLEWLSGAFNVTNAALDRVELAAVWSMYSSLPSWEQEVKSNRAMKKELQSRGFRVFAGTDNKVFVHGLAEKPVKPFGTPL